ncbi:MAG: molecular chaperone HtpG [Tissierellia bacterium]|nr:molecular chaperone HtpG [Tissierellia bacterium]
MKKEFKAEAKKVMQLMINSIYTNREIFLRELISNASDALDKRYYEDMKSSKEVNKDDYYIEIIRDKENKTLTIKDTGIGMDEQELTENLGTIATSGTEKFRKSMDKSDISELIGQFGVGFYSAFMVADKVEVLSKKNDKAYLWTSENAENYEITEADKNEIGTEITLFLKDNEEDENYDRFLEEYTIESLVNKYSNYIRYPIYMLVTKSRKKDPDDENSEYEDYQEKEVLNSKEPIWKRPKSKLKEEDYINFYKDQHFGFDEPLSYMHLNLEGLVEFKAILYIPGKAPFDYGSKTYQKGLALYSNGVKIMDKCEDIIDDSFSFVKGVVDSEDISLNISRETLQKNRQLRFISKQINSKIRSHLLDMLKNDREKYDKFYEEFQTPLKVSLYESYGAKKDELIDLLQFDSKDKNRKITLKEYVENLLETEDKIYYAAGDSIEKIKNSPALSSFEDKDVLFLTDKLDEFLFRMLRDYEGKEFKSITELENDENEENQKDEIFEKMKEVLPDEVVEVRKSDKLKDNPVVLLHRGEVSIEMEKTFKNQPNAPELKAQKVLEINENSKAYDMLKDSFENDKDRFEEITKTLFDQAKIIEGLEIENPTEYVKNIWKLIK